MQQLSNWLCFRYAHRWGGLIGGKLNNYEFTLLHTHRSLYELCRNSSDKIFFHDTLLGYYIPTFPWAWAALEVEIISPSLNWNKACGDTGAATQASTEFNWDAVWKTAESIDENRAKKKRKENGHKHTELYSTFLSSFSESIFSSQWQGLKSPNCTAVRCHQITIQLLTSVWSSGETQQHPDAINVYCTCRYTVEKRR